METTLTNRIMTMFKGAGVKRNHTYTTLKEQTVGQHSFRMLVLLHAIGVDGTLGLYPHIVQYIIAHDLPEGMTGDNPYPFKKFMPSDFLNYIEDYETNYFENVSNFKDHWEFLSMPQTQEPMFYYTLVKLLDMLELYIFIAEERALGNTTCRVVADNCDRAIRKGLHKLETIATNAKEKQFVINLETLREFASNSYEGARLDCSEDINPDSVVYGVDNED